MTQPIKIQAKHRPAAKAVAVTRQSQPEKSLNSVKKAPAPPPNPHLVNLQDGPSPVTKQPQVNQDFQQNASGSAAAQQPPPHQEPQKPYDRHSDGALTYFNYYFEELASSSTRADYPASPTRAKIPVAAIGAGVMAATIASGAIISDAINQPEAPQSRQPLDSEVKQNVDAKQPRPTTTAPEKIETGRSLSSSPTQSTPPKTSTQRQPAPALKQTQGTANSLITSGPLLSNAPPLKLSPLSLRSAPPATSSPTAAGQSENLGSSSNSLKDATRREIARRIANLPAVAPPETLPPATAFPGDTGTVSLPTNLDNSSLSTGKEGTQPINPSSSQVPSQSANSQTTAFPPGSGLPTSTLPGNPSPDIPGSSQTGTTAANSTILPSEMTVPGSNSSVSVADSPDRQAGSGQAVSEQRGIAPGDRLMETGNAALNRVTPIPIAGSPAMSPATAPDPLANNTAESIQDYLNRPPKPAADAPSLMPLSSKAAGEAVAKPQIGAFTVRQVNQQDYQKEWQTSNRNPSDPAIAYAFPAYGFIDYQRQVIVVLKEQPGLNPMQSQRISAPNS